MTGSKLDLILAGTRDAILMIEGYCDFLTEEQMLQVRGRARAPLPRRTCGCVHTVALPWGGACAHVGNVAA